MIRVALDFARTMLRFPAGWLVWIAALMLVNGAFAQPWSPLFLVSPTNLL